MSLKVNLSFLVIFFKKLNKLYYNNKKMKIIQAQSVSRMESTKSRGSQTKKQR